MAERIIYSVIFTALIVGLTVMAAATPTLAGQANSPNAAKGQFFIGFWEGIDPLDGSTAQLSISDNDQDGMFDFIYRESFFSTCFTDENTKGRGVLTGTASVVEQGAIEGVADQICKNDDNTEVVIAGIFLRIEAVTRGGILNVDFGILGLPILVHRTGD